MRAFASIVVSCGIALCSGVVLAQEEAPEFLFGEYHTCDLTREGFADVLVEKGFGPILDKHVEEGHLTGWGWLSHNAGGNWRKLLFYASPSLETLLDTRNKMFEEFQSELSEESREFSSICTQHDDLLWTVVAQSPAAEEPGPPSPASYSTYYICDTARQERADEIVQEVIKPAADTLVASGEMDSWTWYAHVIGGRYRRLMTHAGSSHAALIEAVNRYNEAASEANEALANEFSEICNSHVDYLWDRLLPKPASDD